MKGIGVVVNFCEEVTTVEVKGTLDQDNVTRLMEWLGAISVGSARSRTIDLRHLQLCPEHGAAAYTRLASRLPKEVTLPECHHVVM
ncbi:MAG: hypothetical protein AB7S38_19450 [Vulcanimicrobiota bacterium]